jgi:hypothetical protein
VLEFPGEIRDPSLYSHPALVSNPSADHDQIADYSRPEQRSREEDLDDFAQSLQGVSGHPDYPTFQKIGL